MALNSMPDQDDLYAGEPLRLVASAPEIGNPSNPAPTALAQQAANPIRNTRAAPMRGSPLSRIT